MLEHLRNLVNLQEVDAKIHRLKKERQEIPEKLNDLEKELEKANLGYTEQKARLIEVQRDHKIKEQALDDEEENLKKWQKRLLEIKNTREYVALQREIESQKRSNSQREEEILLMLEEIEVLGKNVALLEESYKELEKKRDSEKAAVEQKIIEIDKEVQRLDKERRERLSKVEPELLAKYEHIRDRRAGIGVALVRDGHCLACMMGLPPQLYNELMRYDAVHTCPSCGRILVWEGKGKTAIHLQDQTAKGLEENVEKNDDKSN
ncbi:MAG: hypothetical protein GXP49_00425 [Deltaproteobacteria bacterium]|nr:hypothetical protein [Deltaproteobacteria bacterium]